MERFINSQTGEYWDGSPILSNVGLIFNPSEEDLLNNGWELESEEIKTSETPLEEVRNRVLFDAENYYKSSSVSGMYLNETLTWIPTEDRVKYMIHLKSMVECGRGNEILECKGVSLDVNQAIEILNHINCYVLECHQVFVSHLENIKKFTSVEDLESYDYTGGYPEVLEISI